ncbi:MAG: radical SAM family heme chaperone HemW [bacterium]
MAGVYISYPFCARKCTFCNFASGVFPRDLEERYTAALCAELARFRWRWTPETVYIGGGTPSRMSADALARVLSLVPGRPWREATIEAAPGAITPEQAEAWRSAGINRVSLGVQSFVARELAGTGRTHSAAAVASDVAALRAVGITDFNIDLIAGLPRQTAQGWEESLDWIERLEAPHVSVYMLEVDEDSRLGAEMLRGGARYGAAEAPGEAQVVAFYERAVERLERAGIRQYEISNFARPGSESLHNLKYWRLEPYAGFGADAHSFDVVPGRKQAVRRQNPETVQEYLAGAPPLETPATPEERFFVGLRLREGIPLSDEDRARHADTIARHTSLGRLEEHAGRLRLTRRGILFSNEVLQDFLP